MPNHHAKAKQTSTRPLERRPERLTSQEQPDEPLPFAFEPALTPATPPDLGIGGWSFKVYLLAAPCSGSIHLVDAYDVYIFHLLRTYDHRRTIVLHDLICGRSHVYASTMAGSDPNDVERATGGHSGVASTPVADAQLPGSVVPRKRDGRILAGLVVVRVAFVFVERERPVGALVYPDLKWVDTFGSVLNVRAHRHDRTGSDKQWNLAQGRVHRDLGATVFG